MTSETTIVFSVNPVLSPDGKSPAKTTTSDGSLPINYPRLQGSTLFLYGLCCVHHLRDDGEDGSASVRVVVFRDRHRNGTPWPNIPYVKHLYLDFESIPYKKYMFVYVHNTYESCTYTLYIIYIVYTL